MSPKYKIKNWNIWSTLLLALILRLILMPLASHGDVNNHAIWGIYAQEFGLRGFYDWINFGNYAWPGYPPFTLIVFYLVREIWQIIFNFLWFLNVNIPMFPSTLITWMETGGYHSLLKLPATIADLLIGFIIYRYFNEEQDKKAVYYASFYLFNPAIIYVSSAWGQIESLFSLFLLIGILDLNKKKLILGWINYFVSLMFKATTAVAFPVFFIDLFRNRKTLFKNSLLISISLVGISIITAYIFYDKNYLIWFLQTYFIKLLPGPDTLPFITVNAFNFWGLISGPIFVRDSMIFFGNSLHRWGYLLTFLFLTPILYKYVRRKNLFETLFLMFYTAFMFLPRMHERYLFPIFVLLPFLVGIKKRYLLIFYLSSLVFILNLYSGWWFPEIHFLKQIVSSNFIQRGLSLINLALYLYIYAESIKSKN